MVPTDLPIEFSFDHVGIAVSSLEKGRAFYESMGLNVTHVEEVASEKVKVAMLELANECRIELLESTSTDGPVAKYIEKRGEGIHHICLRVENIREKLLTLKENGYRLINEEPKRGAHNCLVAFVHPKSTGGVLLELSEPEQGIS